jgi:hypothetical protein
VIQSGTPSASIYGAANATTAGDTLTLTVTPSNAVPTPTTTTVAAANGSWSVTLGNMVPSTDPMQITVTSKASGVTQTLTNVLRGNVFVCSGQVSETVPDHPHFGSILHHASFFKALGIVLHDRVMYYPHSTL